MTPEQATEALNKLESIKELLFVIGILLLSIVFLIS